VWCRPHSVHQNLDVLGNQLASVVSPTVLWSTSHRDHDLITNQGLKTHVLGSKPCVTFHGDLFDRDANFMEVKSHLLDFFRLANPSRVNLGIRCGLCVGDRVRVRISCVCG